MSYYIQLPYGFVEKSNPIQLKLLKNYAEFEYFKRLPYLANRNPNFDNEILTKLQNSGNLKK